MVNKKETEAHTDTTVTSTENDTTSTETITSNTDAESVTAETDHTATIASLEAKVLQLQEEASRAKADFLNARRRLEEERKQDAVRHQISYIRSLLPMCDSFQMAMQDSAWKQADAAWKKGIEGIFTQLQTILKQYNVSAVEPVGESFDHHQHEAVGTEAVTDPAQQDTVISVLQRGYELTDGDTTHLIRPARVTTGELKIDN